MLRRPKLMHATQRLNACTASPTLPTHPPTHPPARPRRCLMDWAVPGCLGDSKKDWLRDVARAMKLGNKADASEDEIQEGQQAQVWLNFFNILDLV